MANVIFIQRAEDNWGFAARGGTPRCKTRYFRRGPQPRGSKAAHMDDVRKVRDETIGHNIEDLCVGMSAVYARTVTETDIILFAGISGDNNPVHMNEVYAQSTVFKSRIVHGLLSASFVSTVIASKLPGPGSIYLSQNLR